jgi:predicted Zn-ribbon and HTH transcriptional regulator
MKSSAITCNDCGHVTDKPKLNVPAIRCEKCNSVNVLWKEPRRTMGRQEDDRSWAEDSLIGDG